MGWFGSLRVPAVGADEAQQLIDDGAVLLDVREKSSGTPGTLQWRSTCRWAGSTRHPSGSQQGRRSWSSAARATAPGKPPRPSALRAWRR